MDSMEAVMTEVRKELETALKKYKPFGSVNEGVGVILKQVEQLKDELWKKKPRYQQMDLLRRQARQIAAMAVRFMLELTASKSADYQLKTPEQRLICAYKRSLSIEWNDRSWDKANYAEHLKPAQKLLGAFGGRTDEAIDYIGVKAKYLQEHGLSYKLRTIATMAWDDAETARWRHGTQDMAEPRHSESLGADSTPDGDRGGEVAFDRETD